jgi:hypothetical protein
MMDIQRVCDECGEAKVTKSWQPEHVPLTLSDTVSITIHPTVPVWTCAACGDAYTDHEGEDIRAEAVKSVQVAFAAGQGKLAPLIDAINR